MYDYIYSIHIKCAFYRNMYLYRDICNLLYYMDKPSCVPSERAASKQYKVMRAT